jgi:hypothetical protein
MIRMAIVTAIAILGIAILFLVVHDMDEFSDSTNLE